MSSIIGFGGEESLQQQVRSFPEKVLCTASPLQHPKQDVAVGVGLGLNDPRIVATMRLGYEAQTQG